MEDDKPKIQIELSRVDAVQIWSLLYIPAGMAATPAYRRRLASQFAQVLWPEAYEAQDLDGDSRPPLREVK